MTELQDAIAKQNPWWNSGKLPEESSFGYERRFLSPLGRVAFSQVPRRTVILFGQRRVGKTVILKQLLGQAIERNLVERKHVCFVDVQKLSAGLRNLTEVFEAFRSLSAAGDGRKLVIFDEIQFAEDWPHHLKTLTDHEKDATFIASGSVSVVLNPKHRETGHGRLRDLYIPPLLFFEYLEARGKWPNGLPRKTDELRNHLLDEELVSELNADFLDYMNFGSFVELLGTDYTERQIGEVQSDAVARAVIREIPMHYELRKTQALERLYRYVAKHNGQELTKRDMSDDSEIEYKTVNSYLEYLTDAYFVRSVPRADNQLKRLQREYRNKYILENTAHHTCLFGELNPDVASTGNIVEATAFSQTLPFIENEINFVSFKRDDKTKEIDMIHRYKNSDQITRICEIKWSDRETSLREAARNLSHFASWIKNKDRLDGVFCTTRSTYPRHLSSSRDVTFMPAAQYCLLLGMEIFSSGVYSRMWNPGHPEHDGKDGGDAKSLTRMEPPPGKNGQLGLV